MRKYLLFISILVFSPFVKANSPIVIGIAGDSAAGKSYLSKQLTTTLGSENVAYMPMDSYYLPLVVLKNKFNIDNNEFDAVNFFKEDTIDTELFRDQLIDLKQGALGYIDQPVYSYKENDRTSETVRVYRKKFILVDGMHVLSNSDISSLLDVRVLLLASKEELLERRRVRDLGRGWTAEEIEGAYDKLSKPVFDVMIEKIRTMGFPFLQLRYGDEKSALDSVLEVLTSRGLITLEREPG